MVVAAVVMIYVNLSAFNCPWSNIYVDIKEESYVYQSVVELSILACVSPVCPLDDSDHELKLHSMLESSLDPTADVHGYTNASTSSLLAVHPSISLYNDSSSSTLLASSSLSPTSPSSSLRSLSSFSSFCCSHYNNGNLFIFPQWGLYMVPTFPPPIDKSKSYHTIESILYPFQIASYPTIFLMVISTILCFATLAMSAISFVYPNCVKYESQKRPLRLAILCNTAFMVIYFIITIFYLHGGNLSYGWWMTSYATAMACMGYFIGVTIESEGLDTDASNSQELIQFFQGSRNI